MPSSESLTVHVTLASAAVALHIGQHVRHRGYRGQHVTGTIQGLAVESDGRLMAQCMLDEPTVIPADQHGPEIRSYWLHAPAHEFTALDERDELILELVGTLAIGRDSLRTVLNETPETEQPRRTLLQRRIKTMSDVIAKATGSEA